MKIAWTKFSVRDLYSLREYIAADNPEAAQNMLERVAKAIEQLLAYPNMGRSGRIRGTRELLVVGTPYIVPYRVKKDRIEILAVLHSARRWPGEL